MQVGTGIYLDPTARAALHEMNAVEMSVEVVGLLVFLVATVQLLRLERSAVAWLGAAFFLSGNTRLSPSVSAPLGVRTAEE